MLFDKFSARSLHLANRMVMAPMTRSRATPEHTPGALMATYYGQRATAGLIITEGTSPSPNGLGYLTYLDVDNADLSLRPGMTATATIVATQRNDVLLVPNAALRFAPTTAAAVTKKGIASGIQLGPPKTESRRKGAADNASTAAARQVWVLPVDAKGATSATGVPVAVAVVPGISDGHMTEIVGGDLKVGMQVVTAQKTAGSK
jgi:HlyD family secretion protein